MGGTRACCGLAAAVCGPLRAVAKTAEKKSVTNKVTNKEAELGNVFATFGGRRCSEGRLQQVHPGQEENTASSKPLSISASRFLSRP
jgi:hypothetical protein